MFDRTALPSVLMVLLLAGAAIPAPAAAASQGTYAGTHVSFQTTNTAIVDYGVNGESMFQSAKIQSKQSVQDQGGLSLGADLSAVTDFSGAPLSLSSQSETTATVTTQSDARVTAHDDGHGILVVRSGGKSQYVGVNLSASSQAESEGDHRVLVTTENGTQGTFIVVGDGSVTVNDEGNVTAQLGSDGTLVFRSYPDGRDEPDAQQERLIQNGTASAEVSVTQSADQRSATTDVVQYDDATSIDVSHEGDGQVTMTVDRSVHDGTVVITSVSDAVVDASNDVTVTVDGHAAARAESAADLRAAAQGGETSKYLVRQNADASADATVLVAVNHFSERQLSIQSADASPSTTTADAGDGDATTTSTATQGGTDQTTSSAAPGFGIAGALLALLAAVVGMTRR